MKKISYFLIAIALLCPMSAFAQTPAPQQNVGVEQQRVGTVPAAKQTGGITNPLKGVDSIGQLFTKLAQVAIDIAYIVIAAFLLISGFKFVKAQGNPEALANAKKTFLFTLLGALIIIGVDTLVSIFRKIIEGLS